MSGLAFRLSLALSTSILLQSCYAAKQAYYQGNLLATRRPSSDLIWRHDTPEPLKEKLRLVERICTYAEKSGLNVGGAYSYYIQSPNPDAVSFLVQAAEPLQLKFKTWWFPLVGSVPYLGYYHKIDRDEMASQLKQEGLDVSLGQAEAFSLLGWMDDPIFSSMLDRSEDNLSHLLFHELTHRTLWIPGEAEFNENLAEFVAIHLNERYLAAYKASALPQFRDRLADRSLYVAWLKQIKSDLNAVYAQNSTDQTKLSEKAKVFAKATGEGFPKFRRPEYQKLRERPWNNASVLGASMYLPDLEPFEKALSCLSDKSMAGFLEKLEDHYEKSKDPRKALAELCTVGKLS